MELGEEPHVLAGEDTDVPRPAGPLVPRGDCACCGHTPEERKGVSCSTLCLLPRARVEERGPGSQHQDLTAGHHPHGTEGQSQGPSPATGCTVAAVYLPWALHYLFLQLGDTGMAQRAAAP